MHISSPTYTRVALMRTAKFLASSQHASFDSRSERETAQADSQTHTHTHTNTKRKNTRTHIFLVVSPEIGMHSVTSYSNPNSKDGESERRWSRLSCISLSLSLSLSSTRCAIAIPLACLDGGLRRSAQVRRCHKERTMGDQTKGGNGHLHTGDKSEFSRHVDENPSVALQHALSLAPVPAVQANLQAALALGVISAHPPLWLRFAHSWSPRAQGLHRAGAN